MRARDIVIAALADTDSHVAKLAEFLETPVPATWERAKQTNLAAMVWYYRSLITAD